SPPPLQNPTKSDSVSSRWPFSLLNSLLGAIALLFFIVSVVFILLYICSNKETKEVENELERFKEISRREGNEPMSCVWMKECRRKRSGPPPLLVISLDGFANRYVNWKTTPTIKKMGECGGRAEAMYPSFPSKTFPNHYSIATGLYPGSHGIIDNSFYTPNGAKYDTQNGTFYEGEPIWNTVVKNGKVSKTLMWLGSYDKINGLEASYHAKEYMKNTHDFISKIDKVTDWLISDDPPALSMLYLEEPDETGHYHGPQSNEVNPSFHLIFSFVNKCIIIIGQAGVLGCTNIALVSDHGMRNIKKYVNLNETDPEYPSVLTSTGNNVLFYQNISITSLHCKNGSDYRVYRSREDFPLRFHYDHENIGFPYVMGNPGTIFVRNDNDLNYALEANKKGQHGWDNMDSEMEAIFYTMGPSIRPNITIAPFQNINLYNFFADVMQIRPSPNNGTAGLLDDLLVEPPKRENPFHGYQMNTCENVSFEECSSPEKNISTSSTTGILQSRDSSICSISFGRLFLLYSTRINRTIGMEIHVENTGSYKGETATKINNRFVGQSCEKKGGSSALTSLVPESSLKLTWTNFSSSFLVERAMKRLGKKKNIRIQIGNVYRADGSISYVFISGMWCEDGRWGKEKDYCSNEKETRTESYVIPSSAVDNFNCL
ncbi:hypothetical protein PMAYCL1PPCAC_29034, partial [Pristionchus mayeri]